MAILAAGLFFWGTCGLAIEGGVGNTQRCGYASVPRDYLLYRNQYRDNGAGGHRAVSRHL